jgi:hypothetical protein
MDKKGIVPVTVEVKPTSTEVDPNDRIEVGQWYLVKDDPKDEEEVPDLRCVTEIGSNYAKVVSVNRSSVRFHFDVFHLHCERCLNPEAIIDAEVKKHQDKTDELMEQVRALTARLGVSQAALLGDGEASMAMVLASDKPAKEYKDALILAKTETLPDLFEQIEKSNKQMGKWMKAKLIPLYASAEGMKHSIGAIENRIFSVELYAGLVETVKRVHNGEPAKITDKVHLMQRRMYMDEECLAQYTTGGMDIKNLGAFDRWLAKPKNLNRLLPFPRCIAAFQVRRHTKERECVNLSDFLRIMEMERTDKYTYLYIRNGQQLFRLNTEIEFGENLFPDLDKQTLDRGCIWAKVFCDSVESIISDNEYQGLVEEEKKRQREYDETPEKDKWRFGHGLHVTDRYKKFSPDDVNYDDIKKFIGKQIQEHNRVALILQGLLDRSPVLHPHPPWLLWTPEGFKSALELIYDDSRALTTGDMPDFEAYRAKLNLTIKVGSVTIGQEEAWEKLEASRENARRQASWRDRDRSFVDRYRPYGNPGPGTLARVVSIAGEKCTYTWDRERRTYGKEGNIREKLVTKVSNLMNVDAYKPGDFHIFFDDPRTRAEYLKWAPMLLEAEEYHAGNRKIAESSKIVTMKAPSWEGKRRYQMRKERKALMGKAVRLSRDVEMKSGKIYKKDSLWRVCGGQGRDFDVVGINKDGSYEKGDNHRVISRLNKYDFVVDLGIPGKPDPKKESDE